MSYLNVYISINLDFLKRIIQIKTFIVFIVQTK